MLKGRRKNKSVMQPVCDLSIDPMVESVQRNQEMLDEALKDVNQEDVVQTPAYWAEKYAEYTPEGYTVLDLSRNYEKDFFEALKTHKWTDLADCYFFSFTGHDPFSTANTRDQFFSNSDLDHFKVAVSRYIQAIAGQSAIDREEVQALHHIVTYWQKRCTHSAVEGGEVLR